MLWMSSSVPDYNHCTILCACACVQIGHNSEIKLMLKVTIYTYPSGAPEFTPGF